MATFDDIKAAIQVLADAIDDPGAYGLRSPGDKIEVSPGVEIRPGGSWGPTKALEIYLTGIAGHLDSSFDFKGKINELIAAYNQLRADYNNGTVPTTAPTVDPLA